MYLAHKGTSAARELGPRAGQSPAAGSRCACTPASRDRDVMGMKVRDGMTQLVLTIGPAHTLREAARLMSSRRVGAAVVIDAEHSGVGILTERDILDSIGAGQDPDTELAAAHRTGDVVFATPEWTLEQAAGTMVRAGFRHLIVLDGNEVAGLLSMRDIVRCWAQADGPKRDVLAQDERTTAPA
jgi:CBS domain-containing protein